MTLEIAKQKVTMITMTTVLVLEVMKVAYALSGPFAKVGAPQAENDNSNPPEILHIHVFLFKSFV